MSKTNACRILDALRIHYELREYEIDPDDLSAESVAAKVGFPAEQVFKTLAVKGDRCGVAVAVIPGSYELDFKALAQLTGDR
jgi:Cys-tRNA(Pro)/Cys-tRNA(Cys) deacylase